MQADQEYNASALWLALEREAYQRLDIVLRQLLSKRPDDTELHLLMARLASKLGRRVAASRHLARANEQALPPKIEPYGSLEERFLLVTEWGFGFWADVGHVLGSLLLAEMTHRKPIVVWSDNSFFSPGGENAWNRYFQPVASTELQELQSERYTYFPPPWSAVKLNDNALSAVRVERSQSTFGLGLLPRDENVLVSDTFVGVPDLVGWIEVDEPYFGMDVLAVQRQLISKYLHLQPGLATRIDTFWNAVMAGRRWLAVHYRGADKDTEVPDLRELNASYPSHIDRHLQDDPDLVIFLMTDSALFLKEMLARYPGRVLATKATRTWSNNGVHTSGNDPVKIAEEVIVDTYLAVRCNAFLGNGSSNVSLAVEALRDWEPGSCQLLGNSWRNKRHLPSLLS